MVLPRPRGHVHSESILVFHSMHGTMPYFQSDKNVIQCQATGRARVFSCSLGRYTQPLPLTIRAWTSEHRRIPPHLFPVHNRPPVNGDKYRIEVIVISRYFYSTRRVSEGHPQHCMRFAINRGRNSNTILPHEHEYRIKTAHLSRFALLLVDVSERVRQAAQKVFIDHLQPRPDTVCR